MHPGTVIKAAANLHVFTLDPAARRKGSLSGGTSSDPETMAGPDVKLLRQHVPGHSGFPDTRKFSKKHRQSRKRKRSGLQERMRQSSSSSAESDGIAVRRGLKEKKWSDRMVLMMVVAFSAVCYWNSLHGEFVHDDLVAVTGNPDVNGQNPISELWKNDFWGRPMSDPQSHKSYRPLTVLTFRLNAAIWGLNDATSFHVINVALHCLAVALFMKFCSRVLHWKRESSVTAAMLFATHPVHTDAVCSVVGRSDILCCVLYLSSLISCAKGTTLWLLGSLVFATLALLAKEPGVTVLTVCMVYLVVSLLEKRSRNSHRLSKSSGLSEEFTTVVKIGLILTTLLVLIHGRSRLLYGALPQFSDQDNPAAFSKSLKTRFLTYLYLPAFNLWLLLCPWSLSYDWQMGSISLVEDFWDEKNLTSLSYLAAIGYLVVKLCSGDVQDVMERKRLSISLSMLVFPFLPASNLFVTVGFVVAERVLYIPSLGFCLLVTHGLQRLAQKETLMAWICRTGVIVMLLLFTVKTVSRNNVWISRESLFKSGIESAPNNAKMHYNYANYAKDIGDREAATYHYGKAIELWPNHASSHNNLGTLLNDSEEAENHFREALRIQPLHVKAQYNLASLYSKRGEHEIAKTFLLRVIQLEPDFVAALSSLATLYAETEGKMDEAEKLHLWATSVEPANADALNNYGTFLEKAGRMADATAQYERAISVNPNHTVAILNAAIALKTLKRSQKAEELYKRALEIEEDPRIMDNLGLLYASSGRYDEARKLYESVLSQYPNHNESKLHLAQLLLEEHSYDSAEQLLLSLRNSQWSGNSTREIYHLLATLYSLTNRTAEALDSILKALNFCISSDASCAVYYAEHGDILKDLEEFASAEESYKMALTLDPKLARTHLNLAVIYHLRGKYINAKKHYEEAYSLDSSPSVLLENMRKLQRRLIPTTDDKCFWKEPSCHLK